MEEWKQIIENNKPVNYDVSNMGQVRNRKTGHYLAQMDDNGGYLELKIHGKTRKVHRLVMETFCPTDNDQLQVNHIDGDKTNNKLSNLEWVTPRQNMRHAVRTGLHKALKGEDHPMNINSEEKIINACEMLESGKYSRKEVANITGISHGVIKQITRGVLWSHISKNYDFSNIPNKNCDHKYIDIHNSLDRAIISGKSDDEIINVLMNKLDIQYESAKNLYKRRKKKIKEGKSIVQNTVYIDYGREIF